MTQGSGHRGVPHTADVAVEAWATSFAGCLEQAVTGVVASFAEASRGARVVEFDLAAGDPVEVLVGLLDELVYRIDVDGTVPVETTVRAEPGQEVHVRWLMADPEHVQLVGALPKAVSLHDLTIAREGEQWRCHVVVDV